MKAGCFGPIAQLNGLRVIAVTIVMTAHARSGLALEHAASLRAGAG